jgi:hypothetical protein
MDIHFILIFWKKIYGLHVYQSYSLTSMLRWVSCHHSMVHYKVANGGDSLQTWIVAANILNKQSWTAVEGSPSSLGSRACGYQLLSIKNTFITKCHKGRSRVSLVSRATSYGLDN